ncbi:conserved membrane protein of unknown function [Thermococcus nautili]|uniref:hypothetical protein n=1 Tax=Thermococcus nautili TaxID=195522 RepID=UPI0027A4728F|nr:conserved membrane protein of unknown function [Thermococcus nautili]
MGMDDNRVFLNYLAFTVPHVTVFAGAVFGILVLLGIKTSLALGIFALLYGVMLLAIALVAREHFSGLGLYRLYLAFSVFLVATGLFLLYRALVHS